MPQFQIQPEHLFLAAETGYHLIRLGCPREGLAIFEGLRVIDETNAYYRMALAAAHAELRDWKSAIVELDALLLLEPDHREARIRRCVAKIWIGDANGADADIYILRARGIQPEARWLERIWIENFEQTRATGIG